MIRATDICFGYHNRLVIDSVGLEADHGEVVGLIGPNGSGKSTFLRVLYAALRPRAGLVTLDDDDVTTLPGPLLARRMAVVAQETPSDVPTTVADMVLLGRSPHRPTLTALTREDHQLAASALTRVGARHLADRTFATLSGGEKQRVLLARALAQQADHVLLDEPTNHLDIRYQHEILRIVRHLDVTTIVVLHDLNLAARYCDRIVMLHNGRVVTTGPPSHVLTPQAIRSVYAMDVDIIHNNGHPHFLFTPIEGSAPG